MKPPRVSLLLDSGAFSVWRRGGSISLTNYMEYVAENKDFLFGYFNLDVIPGRPGLARSPAAVEEAARASNTNARIMASNGLRPIPVFHQGERFYWLERMMDEGHKYIAVSPQKGISGDRNRLWLLEALAKVPASVKLHVLGVQSLNTALIHPWYSIDSVAWTLTAVSGQVMVPYSLGNAYDYRREPFKVAVTERTKGPLHLGSLGPSVREYVMRYFARRQLTLEELQTRDGRMRASILFYREAFRGGSRFFFGLPHGGEYAIHEILTKAGCNDRLTSFSARAVRVEGWDLKHYVRKGVRNRG